MPVARYVGGAAAIAVLSVLTTLLATGSMQIDVKFGFQNSRFSPLFPEKKWDASLQSQPSGTLTAQITNSFNDTLCEATLCET